MTAALAHCSQRFVWCEVYIQYAGLMPSPDVIVKAITLWVKHFYIATAAARWRCLPVESVCWVLYGQHSCVVLLQVFKGCFLGTDILNHLNIDFWHHQQPAYNLRKFISCAGTNFLIRASAFRQAGASLMHGMYQSLAS